MARLYNIARMHTATLGPVTTIDLGAAVTGFLSFANAGVTDGITVSYAINDPRGGGSEVGSGVYHSTGPSFTRTTVEKSSDGTSRISLSVNAEIMIAPAASHLNKIPFSSTDNAITRYDGAEGALQNSGITIDDNDVIAGAKVLPTGSTTARTLQDRFNDIVFVEDFGAVGDGATNDATAIQAAIDYVNGQGGGDVHFDSNEYRLSTALVLSTGVRLVGKGSANTILKLNTNANTPVIKTLNFDTLLGGGTTGGPSDFAVIGMTLDGNRSNQSGAANDLNGMSVYGYRFLIEDVIIRECKGHGWRSDWGTFGEFQMESTIRRLKIDTCGRHGFRFEGPHDTYGEDIIVTDASQETDNAYDGFLINGNGNGRWVALHSWHRSTVTNRMFSGARVETGGNHFVACVFEGGRRCLVQRGDRNTYKATSIFGAFSTNPMATIRGSHVFFDARIEDTVPSGAGCLQIGESGSGGLYFSHIDVMAITAATNAVVISQDDGRNTGIIKAITAANAYTGTFDTTSRIAIQRPNASHEIYADFIGIGISAGIVNPLHIRSGAVPMLAERYSNDASPAAIILRKSRSATLGTNTIIQNGDECGGLRFRGGDGASYLDVASIRAEVDGTPGTNDMPGRLVLGTTADGASTTTDRLTIDNTGLITIASGQIKFPASQNASSDANTLDDYEEGTWTPIDSSGASLSLTTVSGTYVKIGSLVTASGSFTYPSTVNGTNAKIGGLPFAVASGEANRQGILSYTGSATASKVLPDPTATTFSIYTAAGAAVTNAGMSTSINYTQCTYKA